jgi:hypothetical protein
LDIKRDIWLLLCIWLLREEDDLIIIEEREGIEVEGIWVEREEKLILIGESKEKVSKILDSTFDV